MRSTRIRTGRLILTVLLLFTAFFLSSHNVAKAQSSFTTITSYRVDGAPNYNAPGDESFWRGISWTNVPLVASVSPGGGHTPNVLVKSANDGFNVYVLFRWNDSSGPSYGSESEQYVGPGGVLLSLNPQNTSSVKQLFYNSTYYYQDRAAMLWFTGNNAQRQQSPVMQLGSNGSITGGAANIWHWQSVPTDNNLNDPAFPGGYTNPSGTPILPPDNVSFAENDYTNMTGFFLVGGTIPGLRSLDPYADPFIVRAGNYFSTANKTWTVEMVRSFSVAEAARYQVQLVTGSNYFVAFAIWNGKMGESAHIKSVSQWYSFTISNQSPSLPSSTVGGVSILLAGAAGAGLLIVGLIIGLVFRPRMKELKG